MLAYNTDIHTLGCSAKLLHSGDYQVDVLANEMADQMSKRPKCLQ